MSGNLRSMRRATRRWDHFAGSVFLSLSPPPLASCGEEIVKFTCSFHAADPGSDRQAVRVQTSNKGARDKQHLLSLPLASETRSRQAYVCACCSAPADLSITSHNADATPCYAMPSEEPSPAVRSLASLPFPFRRSIRSSR